MISRAAEESIATWFFPSHELDIDSSKGLHKIAGQNWFLRNRKEDNRALIGLTVWLHYTGQ